MENAIQTAERFAEKIHACPESSFAEYETTRLVRGYCEECGVSLVDLGMETGAAAYLDCGREQTVALRADMDAVTTTEGPRHLCGHDYHTAALLGAMGYLSARRAELPHNVAFLFQPAEENVGGARVMLERGLMEKLPQRPSRLFGIHNRPEIDCGKVAVHEGPLMAEKGEFKVVFTGKLGHGGTPHLCIDPLVAAAQFVTGAQSIVSRNVDPLDAAVCAVCSFHSGSEMNFAPENAVLTGSVRTLRRETYLRIEERLKALAEQTALGFECKWSFTWTDHVPCVVNAPEMTEIARRAAEKAVGAEHVVDTAPCLGAEDYAVFAQAMPSFFYWVGSGVPGGNSAPWHSPAFRVAEGYLDVAVPLLVRAASEP